MAKKKTGTRRLHKAFGQRRLTTASLGELFPDFRPTQFVTTYQERRQRLLKELREAYLHRGLVLYAGAGVSRSVGLPSWPELIQALSVAMMGQRVETAIDKLETLGDAEKFEYLARLQVHVQKGTDTDKPTLMMARAIKDGLDTQLPFVLARTLYRPVYSTLRSRWADELYREHRRSLKRHMLFPRHVLPTSELIDSIVALCRAERAVHGVQAIVNYNYDDLLDEKLREQHVRCKTVLSGRDSVPDGTLPCYHVHGLISSKDVGMLRPVKLQGNFVFSEDEYHAEYSDPYKWSNMIQVGLLGRFTGLFVGLSLEDPNIRRLVDVTHKQYPENINYAILPRKRSSDRKLSSNDAVMRNLLEAAESESFERIGVRAIWVDEFDDIPKEISTICQAPGHG